MKPESFAWQKLVAASREVSDDRGTESPYGFSTRVAALAWASRSSAPAFLERASWRALGIAGLLAVIGLAANYSAYSRAVDDDGLSEDGAVAALVDVS